MGSLGEFTYNEPLYYVSYQISSLRGTVLRIPMESLNDHEIGYIAGFLDADGSIQMGFKRKSGKDYDTVWFRLVFYNTNREVIQWIADLAGTTVSIRPLGTVNDMQKKEQYISYVVAKKKIKHLLIPILPYLRIKKESAILLLEAIKIANTKPRGEQYPERIYEIKELIAATHDKGYRPKNFVTDG